jgi:hypothetical protein
MKGFFSVNPVSALSRKGKIIPKLFISLIFMVVSTSMVLAECLKEYREKAVKAGINPKVVKILCGDSLEEDYVFEVIPMKKRKEPFKYQKHRDVESREPQKYSLDLPLDSHEGPPSCEEEKVGKMIVRGLSDHLIRSICGEDMIPEKSEKDLKHLPKEKACNDSKLHNFLKDEICLKH